MGQKYAQLDNDRLVTGFYADDIHGDAIPDGAVKISDETWQALLDGQGAGQRMAVNEDGSPDLRDPPPPSKDELAANARARRNAALAETDWIVTQQQEQILTGAPAIDNPRLQAIAHYRQALRDVPQQAGFPDKIDWPDAPG